MADANIAGLPQREAFRGNLGTQREATQRDRDAWQSWRVGQARPRVGRGVDGLAGWLDSTRWPALPGEQQHEWEPPRTVIGRDRDRAKRLKALGNAVVPQQIAPILHAIVEIERNNEVKCE